MGRVMAERINDVCAKVNTKRHKQYLHLMARQIGGYADLDPNDQYRHRPLVERALQAYSLRHGCQVERSWFYRDTQHEFIGCQPDGIEPNVCGLTAHIRETEETYERAVDNDTNLQYTRVAQVSMAITGLRHWIHLDYFEDPETRKRRLSESLFNANPMGDDLVTQMAFFYCRAAQEAS